jgi:hypothetical protein
MSGANDEHFSIRNLFRRPFELHVVWAILPFVLITGGMALLPLRSWDYWWHIAMGRIIDATHEVPTANHFLYTLDPNHPSFIQPWLSQWTLYRLHETVGLHGVLICRNLATGVAYGLIGLWAAKRSASMVVGAILALATLSFGFLCIEARSALPAWPWFLVVLWVAFRIRDGEARPRFVIAIPAITLLWVNLHGSFLVPIAVSFAFLSASITDRWFGPVAYDSTRVRRWAFILLTSCAATLVNPQTYRVYSYLADLASNREIRTTVTEWFPVTPFFPEGYGALFFVLAIGALGSMALHRRKLDPADLYLLLGFSIVALGQSRGLLWFGLVWPIVASPYGPKQSEKNAQEWTSPIQEFFHIGIATVMVVCVVAIQPWTGTNVAAATIQVVETRQSRPLLGLVTADTPVEPLTALRDMQASSPKGLHMFHDHRYAGYLLYQLQGPTPEPMVYVDHRIELPPGPLWRSFEALSEGTEWQRAFDHYAIDAALISSKNQRRLIEALERDGVWSRVFENDYYNLFTRTHATLNPTE